MVGIQPREELVCSRRMISSSLLLVLTFYLHHGAANESVTVRTQYGEILGYQTDLARFFYGIPFAQPPTGSLR